MEQKSGGAMKTIVSMLIAVIDAPDAWDIIHDANMRANEAENAA